MKKLIFLLLILSAASLAQNGARYLIITHDDYYNALIPLAEWKTQKGLKTKIVTLSEIGGSSQEQIKNYVANAYNTWQIKPEYLLLVGNNDQIPFPQFDYQGDISHSDNYYTNVAGDFYNEILNGRLWVWDTNMVKTIIAKVLGYEKNPYLADSSWFRKGVTIVNEEEQGQPPSDSLYWSDARYAYNLMLDAGYVHIDSFAYSLGNDRSDVIDAINDGRSYILYRGIGWLDWIYPFDYILVEDMHNGFEMPIVVSATCATIEGIGQQWLNGGTPEEPCGVVGFYGTTTGLLAAAELRSALTRGTFQSIFCDSFSTLGKAAEAGRIAYVDSFGNTLEYNSWTCLGDPEMTVWTTTPKQIEVLHNSTIRAGICTVAVNVQYNSTNVESALVCVMSRMDTTIYHYGRTNHNGNIKFIDEFQMPGDSILITVTGRNLKPYCGLMRIYFSGAPYVTLNSFSVLDTASGNGDLIANPGEDLEIPIWVKNWGDSSAYNVSGVIRKAYLDPYYMLNDTTKDFGNLGPLDSAYTSNNGYNVIIGTNCPDTHQINLQLVIHDANNSTWISDFDFLVHAPTILYDYYYFPGNVKYTTAGDTNPLLIELKNIGSYNAENVIGKIRSDDSLCIIVDSISSFGTIVSNDSGSNQSDPFIITTNPTTPVHHQVAIKLAVAAGVYTDTFDFMIYVGQKDYLIWDPDPNHSSGPVIKSELDALHFSGDYSLTFPYGLLSLYKSMFICAGVVPNTHVIIDTSQTALGIWQYIVLLGGKAYLEGGDVWYSDPHYNHGYDFCPVFAISPIASSIAPGSLVHLSGVNGTFARSMGFDYPGGNSSHDRIAPLGAGVSIFRKNYASDTMIGVCANNRTVGVSFEMGNLDDNVPPSTKLALTDSIMKYFGILPTGISETKIIQNIYVPSLAIYPNPCRTTVTIKFQIPSTESQIPRPELGSKANPNSQTGLRIYDVTGRSVRNFPLLTPYSLLPTTILWNGLDDLGRKVPEGIYFVRLETNDYQRTVKVIFLK